MVVDANDYPTLGILSADDVIELTVSDRARLKNHQLGHSAMLSMLLDDAGNVFVDECGNQLMLMPPPSEEYTIGVDWAYPEKAEPDVLAITREVARGG